MAVGLPGGRGTNRGDKGSSDRAIGAVDGDVGRADKDWGWGHARLLRGSRDDCYGEPGENSNQAETIVTIHRDLLSYGKSEKTGGAAQRPRRGSFISCAKEDRFPSQVFVFLCKRCLLGVRCSEVDRKHALLRLWRSETHSPLSQNYFV